MKKSAFALVVFLGSFGASQAAGPHHPRRAQVNTRLARQNYRIDKKVEDGDMSHKEAKKLHTEDHLIRQEEKDMAKQDNGHITKEEQKVLNQQENHVSKQIKNH